MQRIPLTQGKEALIDDADFERVSAWKWFAVFDGYNWYAKRHMKGHPQRKLLPLPNFILDLPIGVRVDHANRNGLDNQRRNLRICTHSQNMRNLFHDRSNSSGFKGVSWKKPNRRWCAQIHAKGKVRHLGLFTDPVKAARAYDEAAILHFGEFALTNAKLGLLNGSD